MSEPMNDIETDYSDIDMEELDSYLTSPPVRYVTPSRDARPLPRASSVAARVAARARVPVVSSPLDASTLRRHARRASRASPRSPRP